MKLKKINILQIKKIHILKDLAGLDDINYRLIIQSRFNKTSSKNLTEPEGSVLIKILEKLASSDKASYKQLAKIELLHKEIYPNREIKDFIEEELGNRKNIKQLSNKEASKLIYILLKIKIWKRGREDATL